MFVMVKRILEKLKMFVSAKSINPPDPLYKGEYDASPFLKGLGGFESSRS